MSRETVVISCLLGISVVLFITGKIGEKIGKDRVLSQRNTELVRSNELHKQLEIEVAEAKRVTSDPCSRERFRIIREQGINDERFILAGQDMTLTRWNPSSYRFVPNGDVVDFYIDYVPDLEPHHKLVEFHNPQSKFCKDRLVASK